MLETKLHPAGISEELREEIDLFRLLKPFIAYCLRLDHEINNPLSGVLGYADFMLMDGENLTEEQRNELREIVICAERIRKHMDQIGDIKGKLSEKLDLNSVLEFYETAATSSD